MHPIIHYISYHYLFFSLLSILSGLIYFWSSEPHFNKVFSERERERERERKKEREREREREREGERVRRKWRHLVALKLAMNFVLFLAKICILVSPLLKGAEFTLSVAKNVALFETVPILRFASVKWRDRGSKHETNDRISGCTVLLLIEKMNQINTKNYWK